MQNFKKNLGFNLALIAIAGLFIAGCAMAFLAYRGSTSSKLLLTRALKEQTALLNGHAFVPGAAAVSLNDKNVEAAAADVKELEAHLASLRAAISGNPDLAIKGKASANSAELSALLRESVDGWRKLAADQGIKLMPNDPTAFGFHRYIHNQGTAPKRDFQKVDQQRQIIDFIVRQLVESRPAGSPLLIESVDREPVETFVLVPEGKPGAGTYVPDADGSKNEVDEFQPTRTFDRRGLVDSASFRVRFVGYTPTLRTFVNKIRNSGRPVAITTIDVGLATKDIEKLLSAPVASAALPGAAAAPAAPALLGGFFGAEEPAAANGAKPAVPQVDQRVLVVPRKLSSFVVQIDYLSLPEEKPAAGAEGEPKK
ncbi:MAG: Amuc_1100 family pilus-like protein [Opitutales bacterium]|nr:Amuc_1100 family pilus-like protein [Opitutales bacterium]